MRTGVYGHRQRVCTESWLWEKNPLPLRGTLPTELHPRPLARLKTGRNRPTFSHSFFSDTAPFNLSDLLRVYSPSRQLRSSSDSRTLCIPHIKTKTFGHCSFSHAAPSLWNSLPHEIRHNLSTTAFKTALKTHLFKYYLYELHLYSLHLFL